MIRVTALNIKNTQDSRFEKAVEMLPFSIKSEVMRYRKKDDRFTRVFGKLLLKEQLAAFNFESHQITDVQKSTFGKPFLPIELEFNVSHSGEWVVCAASTICVLGIDIEKINPEAPMEIREFFTPEEMSRINNGDDPASALIRIWTRKEAVLKAEGSGISTGLEKVDTTTDSIAFAGRHWFLQDIFLDPAYHCALASERKTGHSLHIFTPALLFDCLGM
ncbi:4'-phosphopantetheinyl transferase family protein [Negadavirga shengliensis]|uniref:4'-phosphopantetheinyl transferase family protein n=1 Tax=Negadavirga shengliensis TaxID=1389218 RepID=A0ABV9SV85_9BACT